MSRPRVIFWDNIPSPYGVEQYNLLVDRGHAEISVWFNRRTDAERSWAVEESGWRFPGVYIDDPSSSLAAAALFAERCRSEQPDLVISPYGERSFLAGHVVLKAIGVRHVLHFVPTFDAWTRRTWWKDATKRILFDSADAIYVPGPDGAASARRHGVSADRIYAVRLTTNIQQYARRLSADGRRAQRDRLGVGGCVFLYVGRLWKPKGLLDLIAAFRQARTQANAISLILVGDGYDEWEIRAAAAGTEAIRFVPFVQAPDLYAYYGAADVFVFPTLGDPHGQVIEEAHAAGLPIIASDAIGDVRTRVEDGLNGFVVPAGDVDALAARMLQLAAEPVLRAAMGSHGAARVEGWGHDAFADGMEQVIDACMLRRIRATRAARMFSSVGRVALYAAGMPGLGAVQ